MIIERFVLHHGGIEHHGDPALGVVDGAERRHRTGRHAPYFGQQIGRTEREAAAGAQRAMQALEVDLGVFQRDHEIERVLLVAQKQVLGVTAWHFTAQGCRLLDGEHRRVFHRRVFDAERVERGEQFVGRELGVGIKRVDRGVGAAVADGNRVAVRRCLGGAPHGDRAAGAGHVFDHDAVAEIVRHLIGD